MVMVDSGDRSEDTRSCPRTNLELRVDIVYDDHASFTSERLVNISEAGMFVATPTPRPPGTRVAFGMRPMHGAPPVRGRGTVVWVRWGDEAPDRPAGMGIRIEQIDPEGCEMVRNRLVHEPYKTQSTGGRIVFRESEVREDTAILIDESLADVFSERTSTLSRRPRHPQSAGPTRRWLLLIAILVAVGIIVAVLVVTSLSGRRTDRRAPVELSTPGDANGHNVIKAGLAERPEIEVGVAGEPGHAGLAGPKEVRALQPATVVNNLRWVASAYETVVFIEADGLLSTDQVTHHELADPPRMVVVLRGLSKSLGESDVIVHAPHVEGLRIWEAADVSPPAVHVAVDYPPQASISASIEIVSSTCEIHLRNVT
jgi:uncharacterized protein (TIGR02266 family)